MRYLGGHQSSSWRSGESRSDAAANETARLLAPRAKPVATPPSPTTITRRGTVGCSAARVRRWPVGGGSWCIAADSVGKEATMTDLSEILETTDFNKVADGFVFTEGPLWHPDDFYYF